MPSSSGRPVQAIEGLWSLARHSVRPHSPVLALPGGMGPAEAAEIEAMFAAVEADGRTLALRLSRKLHPLVERGVPPRVIEAAPVPRAARLRFADGTTVVVKGTSPGDLAVLAMAMQHGSLRPAACRTDPQGSTQLLFSWPDGRRRLSVRVVGLDQPD
ncbi:MAG: hypothetical protein ABSE77_05270 [Acidimicrobiales bacterium]